MGMIETEEPARFFVKEIGEGLPPYLAAEPGLVSMRFRRSIADVARDLGVQFGTEEDEGVATYETTKQIADWLNKSFRITVGTTYSESAPDDQVSEVSRFEVHTEMTKACPVVVLTVGTQYGSRTHSLLLDHASKLAEHLGRAVTSARREPWEPG